MTGPAISRRELFGAAVVGGTGMAAIAHAEPVDDRPSGEPFGYCMNTSTLRGHKIPFVQKLQIIARAGFRAIEPWLNEFDQYVKEGGTVADLRKRLDDLGLSIESAIGFHEWIVDDDTKRAAALEQAKRDMDLLAQLGGKRLAAPAAGAKEVAIFDLRKIAERYRALLDVGQSSGVVSQIELWGHSKTLSRLSEVTFVAVESGHANACLLLDVYHLYKGGSDLNGLRLLSGTNLHVLHTNDYPATPARAEITDAARIYPGDGVAPLGTILRTLYDNGFRGYLSLELFNRDLWNEDPLLVARTGYEKMQSAVKMAMA